MEKLEEIARAISASFREEGAFWDGKWEDESMHSAFLESARAAMKVMQTPTEEMISRGVDAIQEIGTMNRQGVEACLCAALSK